MALRGQSWTRVEMGAGTPLGPPAEWGNDGGMGQHPPLVVNSFCTEDAVTQPLIPISALHPHQRAHVRLWPYQ